MVSVRWFPLTIRRSPSPSAPDARHVTLVLEGDLTERWRDAFEHDAPGRFAFTLGQSAVTFDIASMDDMQPAIDELDGHIAKANGRTARPVTRRGHLTP